MRNVVRLLLFSFFSFVLLGRALILPSKGHALGACGIQVTSAIRNVVDNTFDYKFRLTSSDEVFKQRVIDGLVTLRINGAEQAIGESSLYDQGELAYGFDLVDKRLEVYVKQGDSSFMECSAVVPPATSSDPISCTLSFSEATSRNSKYKYNFSLGGSPSFGTLLSQSQVGITTPAGSMGITSNQSSLESGVSLTGTWIVQNRTTNQEYCRGEAPQARVIGPDDAYCDEGIFAITAHEGNAQILSITVNGSRAHNFKDGAYLLVLKKDTNLTGTQNGVVVQNGKMTGGTGSGYASSFTFTHTTPQEEGSSLIITGQGADYGQVYCSTSVPSVSTLGLTVNPFDYCKQAHPNDYDQCTDCFGKDKKAPTGKLWTAVGCIDTSAPGIVRSLLSVGLGLSGGVVLLSILVGAFMLATSAGEPKKVQEAQEIISAAIIGLLFVIFSAIILQFIGASILHVPGFLGNN